MVILAMSCNAAESGAKWEAVPKLILQDLSQFGE